MNATFDIYGVLLIRFEKNNKNCYGDYVVVFNYSTFSDRNYVFVQNMEEFVNLFKKENRQELIDSFKHNVRKCVDNWNRVYGGPDKVHQAAVRRRTQETALYCPRAISRVRTKYTIVQANTYNATKLVKDSKCAVTFTDGDAGAQLKYYLDIKKSVEEPPLLPKNGTFLSGGLVLPADHMIALLESKALDDMVDLVNDYIINKNPRAAGYYF